MNTPHRLLLSVFRSLSHADAQNRLMRMSDREIAVSLMYLSEEEREEFTCIIAKGKGERIRDEIRQNKKRKIHHEDYLKIIHAVIDKLKTGHRGEELKSYIRPKKRGR